jgi:hypothetical protein
MQVLKLMNHFTSTAPFSRNLDVFGQPAPANYGVDPDTMEVFILFSLSRKMSRLHSLLWSHLPG